MAAGKENKNKPKCASCQSFGCNAGLVNHAVRFIDGERTGCLFECGCIKFVQQPYSGPTGDLDAR